MHGFWENAKMVEGDGGQFLRNRALEFAETSWECYHHSYASPPKTGWKMYAWFSSYGKKTILFYVFLYPVVKQRIM